MSFILYLLAGFVSGMLGGMGMGGAIQLGRSIPMTIMLILCGFIAARWGNRISVGVAVLFMAAGILLASASPGYWFLFAALTLAGLGEGVLEGLATPMILPSSSKISSSSSSL